MVKIKTPHYKFEFYREARDSAGPGSPPELDPKGDWRWRLVAPNGKIVANGGEGYRRSYEMVRTIRNSNMTDGPSLALALNEACCDAGLDLHGRTLKRSKPQAVRSHRLYGADGGAT